MASNYVRQSTRKVIYTQELLIEATKRSLNGETQRKVATALDTNESNLRKQMKAISTV